MAVISTLKFAAVSLVLVGVANGQTLSPEQDINFPASGSASEPLKWLGANSPWFAGPNIHGISNEVPKGCTVEQVAHVTRHGSRYPDNGAYNEWTALYAKIQASQFAATGSMSFISSWKPVLTNPSVQIAQESITGYKELHDMGYTMRTRYPNLYTEGSKFMVWANLYPRVVQTAQMFLRGFLGPLASSLGNVVTVAPSSSPLSLGDSLSPSDLCPNFVDGNGGTYAPAWDAIYLPPVTARINAMISGNLTFTTSDVSIFPYLCGFESQITGNLSPWCGVFTDEELKQYEYRQDLRYFYGTGPGTKLPQTMMLPFLNRLVEILAEGPGITGKYANGSIYNLPNIIMAFANDGQLSETVAGSGVFDEQQMLPADRMPEDRTYMASHFDSMRGTIAFERLNCIVPISSNNSSSSSSTATSTKSSSSSSTYGYSNMTSSTSRLSSSAYSNSTATGSSTFSTSVRSATASSSAGTEKIVTITNHQITTICPPEPTQRANSYSRRAVNSTATTNQTYIRIRLNDAVYPVPSCQDGPGRSCLMSKYAAYIAAKYAASGSWHDNCNVTNPLSPTQVKGASFFTDLSSPWLANVSP